LGVVNVSGEDGAAVADGVCLCAGAFSFFGGGHSLILLTMASKVIVAETKLAAVQQSTDPKRASPEAEQLDRVY